MNKAEVSYVRSYVPADKHLIMSTWLIGLYYGDTLYSLIDKDIFMKYYHKVLESIISSGAYKINVMCDKDDSNVIIGYSVLSPDATVLHWVFVKKDFRGYGVATDLVPETVKTVTHLTKAGIRILKKKNLAYNPFILGA